VLKYLYQNIENQIVAPMLKNSFQQSGEKWGKVDFLNLFYSIIS
jgi:hypothetical protein